jgi:hypothetical protein
MDLTDTIVPRSDQLNAEDLLSGPRTVTITEVRRGTAEQPVDVHLAEFPGRPFKPSKTVRRIFVSAWGPDASTYAGRRLTIYRDPDVKFGGLATGGIRVSHLSHTEPERTAEDILDGDTEAAQHDRRLQSRSPSWTRYRPPAKQAAVPPADDWPRTGTDES